MIYRTCTCCIVCSLKGEGIELNKSMLKTIVLGGTALTLTFALLTYPKEALEASVRGLNTWWKVVFPSLLPFFILSELLIGFGVVRFIGSILEPLMRPLFRVPGVGGFALAWEWVLDSLPEQRSPLDYGKKNSYQKRKLNALFLSPTPQTLYLSLEQLRSAF